MSVSITCAKRYPLSLVLLLRSSKMHALRTQSWSVKVKATSSPLCLRERALRRLNLDGKHLRGHMRCITFAVSRGNGANRDGWRDFALQCPKTHGVQSRWFATQRPPRHPIFGLYWK